MNRNVSLASLLLASTFAIQASAAFAGPAQHAQHNLPHPANVAQPASTKAQGTDAKKAPPAGVAALSVPKMYPPGPSGHDAPPSSNYGE
jgi:hypothetical protein